MNSIPASFPYAILFAIVATVFALISLGSLRSYLGLRGKHAALLALGALLAAIGMAICRVFELEEGPRFGHRMTTEAMFPSVVGRAFLVLFAVPLIVKLYRAWTGQFISEAENQPGAAGFRAWLTTGNLLLAAAIAGSAHYGFALPFVSVFSLVIVAFLACPMVNTGLQIHADATAPAPTAPASARETLSPEREKVLALLEAGKITAEESAELLNALAATAHSPASVAAPLNSRRRLVLAGAGVLLLAFFLPWFSMNPGQELSRITGQMEGMLGQVMSGMPSPPNGGPGLSFSPKFQTGTFYLSGGEIGYGLGWIVLFLGLGVAAFPSFTDHLPARQQRLFSMLALAAGGLIIIYLFTQNLRHAHVGIALAAAGYALEFFGVFKPEPAPITAASGAPRHA